MESHPCESSNDEIFANYCRHINIKAQAPFHFALPLYGYVAPLITLLTIATNSFIVVILSQKHLRTPTNFILLSMAVAELLTGISSSPWLLYFYTFQGYMVEQTQGLPEFWCRLFPYFITYIPTMMHTSAIYLTVFLAVQRYFFMKKSSHIAHKLNKVERSLRISFGICLAAILTELPKMITGFNKTYYRVLPHQNVTSRVCVHHYYAWITQPGVMNIYFSAYFWFQAIFVHGAPCIILVVLTVMLLLKLRRADERRSRLMSEKSLRSLSTGVQEDHRLVALEDLSQNGEMSHKGSTFRSSLRESRSPSCLRPESVKKPPKYLRSTTKMLVVVIGIFLIIEIPVACFFILHVLSISMHIVPNSWYQWINTCIIFRNVLILLSYPINFAIYCGMSEQFRKTAKQILTRRNREEHSILPNRKKSSVSGGACDI